MLYLVRKVNQSIMINNEIEIKIESISRNSVKLAIISGEGSVILRKEVFDKIAEENKSAAINIEEIISGQNE